MTDRKETLLAHLFICHYITASIRQGFLLCSTHYSPRVPRGTGNHDEAHLVCSANTNWYGKCNCIEKCSFPSEAVPVERIQTEDLLLLFGKFTEIFPSINAPIFE